MTVAAPRKRPFDPAPNPGLKFEDFCKICENGFGDGHNSFAHSMAWFKNHLYVGTTRSNFCMIQIQKYFKDLNLAVWPIVDGPKDVEGLYKLDRRSQIWRYDPLKQSWQQVLISPMVMGTEGEEVARDMGYRAMAVVQGESDVEPALYVATWAPGRAPGPLILRSEDGENFSVVSEYGILGLPITSTRVLVPFKGRLFTSPTSARGKIVDQLHVSTDQCNVSGIPILYESRDPANGQWRAVSLPGFGELDNEGIFTVCPFQDQLYAGTFNCKGFQIWRSDCEGEPPYKWTKVIDRGAYRGSLNQIAMSMTVFNDALYVGSAIQNGGNDHKNKIGPAAPELIRIFPDDSWDLIVGTPRDTPCGKKKPLSGFPPGFGSLFHGYFWCMEAHDGWLYLGTNNISTVMLNWLLLDRLPGRSRRMMEGVGADNIVKHQGGFALWRTRDGENWLSVNRQGFGTPYNIGARNLVSTPYGLFMGTANPFGPRVAVKQDGQWIYRDNPRGGLEVWMGSN
jgi:hypothetical protein